MDRVQRYLDIVPLPLLVVAMVGADHRDRVKTETTSHQHLRLNKGVMGRFKEVLSQEQQELCRRRLGRYLQMMGYPD